MKPRSNGFVYHYFLYLLLAKKEIRIQAINICGPLASVIPGFNCTFNESDELVFLNFSWLLEVNLILWIAFEYCSKLLDQKSLLFKGFNVLKNLLIIKIVKLNIKP